MLLAVEGGGFFSSSASGYSKGLTLLLLGQKNEGKPMRVSPWNQYQLVDQESDPDLQLASCKSRRSRGCASFVCFGHTSAGHETPSPLKVGPAQQQDVLSGNPVSEKCKDIAIDDENNARKIALKSSLKKPPSGIPVSVSDANEQEAFGEKGSLKKPASGIPVSVSDANEQEALGEKGITIPGRTGRRRVQWTDACGSELVEIREFEPSEADGSDDEFDNGNGRSCSCKIM